MRRTAKIAVAAVIVIGSYLLLWPVPIEPIAWVPSPDPGLTGVFAENHRLAAIEHLIVVGEGPEDATKGPDGLIYTGLQDGRIVRFDPDTGAAPQTFADTGGRPLGMQFDNAGANLIVADAFRGLLSVDPTGAVSVLTDSVAGKAMIFVDDLDIASDGTIWFSDASQRFDQHEYMLDFLEGRPTGRLLSFDPASGETTIHLEALGFANGVALGPDESYVLVNETLYRKVTRYWIAGTRAGSSEPFVDSLPGHPDNVSYNGDGLFWVAMPAATFAPIESLAAMPFARRVLLRIPGATRLPIPPFGWVLGLGLDGRVLHNLQDPDGGYPTITSVNEIDGYLYLGSIGATSVARLPVPDR